MIPKNAHKSRLQLLCISHTGTPVFVPSASHTAFPGGEARQLLRLPNFFQSLYLAMPVHLGRSVWLIQARPCECIHLSSCLPCLLRTCDLSSTASMSVKRLSTQYPGVSHWLRGFMSHSGLALSWAIVCLGSFCLAFPFLLVNEVRPPLLSLGNSRLRSRWVPLLKPPKNTNQTESK